MAASESDRAAVIAFGTSRMTATNLFSRGVSLGQRWGQFLAPEIFFTKNRASLFET
jgi:hypothetical protein